jgi:hypothetical protein
VKSQESSRNIFQAAGTADPNLGPGTFFCLQRGSGEARKPDSSKNLFRVCVVFV